MRSRVALRSLLSAGGVALVTAAAAGTSINPTTAGFVYLLVVLLIASTWGFVEALVASVAATLCFNFFFFPPTGTFTIADPQNWVALFSFLATALVAGRLSQRARRRTQDAIERQRDIERLYSLSRAILLIGDAEPFAKQLARRLADIFELNGVLLYDRRNNEIHRAGPADIEGVDNQLRDAARYGTSFSDAERRRAVIAVRLGAEPIASIAVEGRPMPDSVLQGAANLVAIGLERARASDLRHEIEVARQSEQLRTTLIDAMAHDFKTPLTAVKAAITSLLAGPEQPAQAGRELLTIAAEEAGHLQQCIENSIEMARLDTAHIDAHPQPSDVEDIVREVVGSFETQLEGRLEVVREGPLPEIALDQRLLKLALRQLLDNALKYSPPATPIRLHVSGDASGAVIELTNAGDGIPVNEQGRVFERFYRSASAKRRIPGSGLGLCIAASIIQAHNGELTVASRPGETTFRIRLPVRCAAGAQ